MRLRFITCFYHCWQMWFYLQDVGDLICKSEKNGVLKNGRYRRRQCRVTIKHLTITDTLLICICHSNSNCRFPTREQNLRCRDVGPPSPTVAQRHDSADCLPRGAAATAAVSHLAAAVVASASRIIQAPSARTASSPGPHCDPEALAGICLSGKSMWKARVPRLPTPRAVTSH